MLAARAAPAIAPPAAPVPDTVVHALVMTFGFAPFFMFGFMFTAGPRWLDFAPPPPSAWRVPGAIAALAVFAMVPRVTCGHSGRMLAADTVTWRLFQLLQVAAVLRICADLHGSSVLLLGAILFWVACLVPWCVKYAPLYWRPRTDGRAG